MSDIGTLDRVLGDVHDVYTEKIRAFAEAYGFGYDFCRFFVQDESVVMSGYYGECTAAAVGDITDSQAEELASFLSCGQFRSLLLPRELSGTAGSCKSAETVHLMKWAGGIKKYDDIAKEELRTDVSISQIYEIASTGFDIDRDKWYTDTSHMLRHGTAGLYILGGCTCAVRMFSANGVTYLSYVCTLPERRGHGLAKKLLGVICPDEAARGNDTFLFCGDELRRFYEDAGFICTSDARQVKIY